MGTITGTFEVTGWTEDPLDEADGVRTTRVDGTQRFSGGIKGEGHVAWTMCYRADGTARFVGLQRVDGTVDGRAGTVVLESTGDHDGSASRGTWRVIPGSGTGALADATGHGEFRAPGGPTVEFELTLERGAQPAPAAA